MAADRQAPKLQIFRGTLKGTIAEFTDEAWLSVPFNPSEYSLDKASSFAEHGVPGLQSPLLQFVKGEARTLTVELLLDSTTYGRSEDVRELWLNKLDELLEVDGKLHAPPPCRVVWGSLDFVGILIDLKKRFVMFTADGAPIRARATLTIKEYLPAEVQLQDPPRSSPDRRRVWRVQDGQNLPGIAFEAYGDSKLWRPIAEASGIDDPLALRPGAVLVVPPLAAAPDPRHGYYQR